MWIKDIDIERSIETKGVSMFEWRWLERSEPAPEYGINIGKIVKILQFRQVIGVTEEIYEATRKPRDIYSEWEDVPTVEEV
jgi:hypothetical protein